MIDAMDMTVTITVREYEELVRQSETLQIVKEICEKEVYIGDIVRKVVGVEYDGV